MAHGTKDEYISRNKRDGAADTIHFRYTSGRDTSFSPPACHHRAFVLWHSANKHKMDPASNRAADSAHRVTHYSRKRPVLNNPGQRIISRFTRARGIALNRPSSKPPKAIRLRTCNFHSIYTPLFPAPCGRKIRQ